MAYTNAWVAANPTDASAANLLGQDIRTLQLNLAERIADVLGVTITTDPLVPTRVGNSAGSSILISGKLAYVPEYAAGNSGSSKTLDLTTNGPNQTLTLTNSCTLTIATPVAGSGGFLTMVQDATGGRTLVWPGNVNFQSNTAPVVDTSAGLATVYGWKSNGTVIFVALFGTAFDVS